MSADNLPRPSTPGPWSIEGYAVRSDDRDVVAAYVPMLDDRLAVRALPEWIDAHATAVVERDALQRRMDAVREWCEQIVKKHEGVRAGGDAVGAMWVSATASHVLALLDGEAGE